MLETSVISWKSPYVLLPHFVNPILAVCGLMLRVPRQILGGVCSVHKTERHANWKNAFAWQTEEKHTIYDYAP